MAETISWSNANDPTGAATWEFHISSEGKRDVTGALWLPPAPAPSETLVCCGHGASGDRYQGPIPELAGRFVASGLPVLAMDGPVHGLRQVGPGGREAFWPEFARASSVAEMLDDWQRALNAVQPLPEVRATRIAYFGLSMGSLYGIPLVGAREDVVAATLGLIGTGAHLEHDAELLSAAARITCPVLFLMQLEDELFPRPGCIAVFDAIASIDKRMHANPGLHPEVPLREIDFAFDFLSSHIGGPAMPVETNPFGVEVPRG